MYGLLCAIVFVIRLLLDRWFVLQQFYTDGARIEAAFRKYFHRAPPSQTEDSYEVLVCHANVIRYVVCRSEKRKNFI